MKSLLPVIVPAVFCRGMYCRSAAETGLNRFAGMTLPANCVRVQTPDELHVVVSGSKIGISAPMR
jgi:hypothetical protein